MVSWDFFCTRRGTSLAAVLIGPGLNDYSSLRKFCIQRGVESPSEAEFDQVKALLKAKEAAKKAPAKQDSAQAPAPAAKEPAKKPVRRRTRKKQT